MECLISNRSNAIADCNTCQRGAILECIISNRSNAITDCNTCQRGAITECLLSNRSYSSIKLYYPTLFLGIVSIRRNICTEDISFIWLRCLGCTAVGVPNLVFCRARGSNLHPERSHRLNSITFDSNLFSCRFLENATLGVCHSDGYTAFKCCLRNNYPKLGSSFRRCAKCHAITTIKRNGCCCFVSHCQLGNPTKGNSCISRACDLLFAITFNHDALDCHAFCIVELQLKIATCILEAKKCIIHILGCGKHSVCATTKRVLGISLNSRQSQRDLTIICYCCCLIVWINCINAIKGIASLQVPAWYIRERSAIISRSTIKLILAI